MRRIVQVMYVILLLAATATTAKAQQQNVCQPLLDGATPAFCEDFATPDLSGLGRGGQLNHANWTYNYLNQDFNTSQSHSFLFPPFTLEACNNQLIPNSGPGNDSVVCSDTPGEPRYWHHGFDDSGSAAVVAARSLQLFDFSRGTETLTFNATATTSGSHTSWIGIFIGDKPVPNPQPSAWPVAGAASLPPNGLYFALDDTNCLGSSGTGRFAGDTARGGSGVQNLTVINNYQEIGIDTPRNCIQVQGGHLNNFQVKLSKTHITISGSDAPTGNDEGVNTRGPNFHTLVDTDINLNFDKGYVYLEMGAYNAGKEFDLYGSTDTHNAQWSSVGWTGPVHPAQRAYSAPNANFFPADGGEVAAGWFLDDPNSPKKFTLTGVDLTNAQAAWLTFTTECASVGGPLQIMYQVNNGPQHIFTDPQNNQCWAHNSSIASVPLSELKNGTNTITLGVVNWAFGLVNVDLLVDPQDTGNPPPPATVSVSISPTTASIQTGASQQFTATVTGSTNTAVTWTASGGSVSTGGLFTAPSSTGAFTITATSVADATKSASATVTVTAPPPPPPTPTAPVISGLATSNITATSGEISWTTDQTASDQVQYGTTTAYGSSSPLNTTLGTSHMVVLNGLTAGTTYHFIATSTNAAGLSTTTADGTFTTAAPPPPPAAVVLVGDNVVEASADTSAPGVAAAFKYTSGQAGTATHLHVYLDASNTAQNVIVAIYTHNGHTNSPGRLLAQGTVTNVVNGDWNTVDIPSVNLNVNTTYWISVLQPAGGTGQLVFRDRTVKGGSDQPSQPNLTTFPATWTPPVIHGAPASFFASN